MAYIYLHGFASSPSSAKAKYLRDRFRSRQLELILPDLNQADFSGLTLTRQINQVKPLLSAKSSSESVTLIGSSFGGLTAAWIAEDVPQIDRLVLLAPAFGFLSHWLPKLGTETLDRWHQDGVLPVFHYGANQELPLRYDFLQDCQKYRDSELQRSVPTLILHGIHDETIPIQASRDFAILRPWVRLIELESNHSLGSAVSKIWQAIQQFCKIE